jgi:hypothetical protein
MRGSLLTLLKKGGAEAVPAPEHRRLDLEVHTTTVALSSLLSLLDVQDHLAHMKMVANPHIDHIPSHAAGAHEAEGDPLAKMSKEAVLVMDQGPH